MSKWSNKHTQYSKSLIFVRKIQFCHVWIFVQKLEEIVELDFFCGQFSIWPPFFQTFQTICATQNFFLTAGLGLWSFFFSYCTKKVMCPYLSFQSIYPVPSLWVIDYISYRKDFLSQIDPHDLFNQILFFWKCFWT